METKAPLLTISILLTSGTLPSWALAHAPAQRAAETAPRQILLAKKKSGKSKPRKPSVTELYRKATMLYDDGRFDLAAASYGRILQLYPGHEPSRLALAKSLYRLENLPEAYRVFAGIDPRYLDAESSYEYGHAFYSQKQYEGALYAFKRVPKGHAFYDLAGYYGAICAFKLKRYQEAETLIENAVVLPSKLIKSRNLYKKNISELKLATEKQELAKEKSQELKRIKTESTTTQTAPRTTKTGSEEPEKTTSPTPQRYQHDGFFSTEVAGRAGALFKSQTVDYGGYSNESNQFQTNYFQFVTGATLPLPMQQDTRKAAFGASALFQAEDRSYQGLEQGVDTTTDEDVVLLTAKGGKGHQNRALGGLDVWTEWPLANKLWIGARLHGFQVFPEFKTRESYADWGGELELGQKTEQREILSSVQHYQVLGPDKEPLYSRTFELVSGSYTFANGVSVGGGLRSDQYQYFLKSFGGPDWTAEAGANAVIHFPYQIDLGSTFTYELAKDYNYPELPGTEGLVFDQTMMRGTLFLTIHPVSWLGIDFTAATMSREFTNLSLNDPAVLANLEGNYPNFISELGVRAALNLVF